MLMRTRWTLGCWVLLQSSMLLAGGKSDSGAPAAEVVAALVRESREDSLDRRALLQPARDDSGNSSIWWQSGYIQHAQEWRRWEDSAVVDAERLSQYQQRRDQAGTGAAAQLKLADWCRDAGLTDQERVHLVQALGTGQTAHPEGILRRLGYRRVGSMWLSDAELAQMPQQFLVMAKQGKRLRPQLEKLAERLESKPALRDKALIELESITSRDTVWLLEQTLASRSEQTAHALVDVLSQIKSYHASQALARMAAFNPWDAVRVSATGELRTRRWEDFVPVLLEYLQEPIRLSSAETVHHSSERGLREWRCLWSREGRRSIEVACSHIFYFRDVPAAQSFTHGQSPFERQVLQWKDQVAAADYAYLSQSRADAANEQIDQRNQSVETVLSAVTGLPAVNSPIKWWDWWDGTIDQLSNSDLKPVVLIAEEFQSFGLPEIRLLDPPAPRREHSCLVAGTPVWTEQGFRPIERIRVGDRVLSKNIETGELKYQPVLHTTHRAGGTVSNLKAGDETIEASLGHNFWVSGRGWTRTNQMRDGMAAHTPTGTVRVEMDDATRTADVYNLVVADFHTYFVGQSMLLGHDVIVPAPTDIRVPGLDPNLAAAK